MSEGPPEAALWDALRGALVTRTLALPGELLVVLDLERVLAHAFSEETRP